MQRTALIVNDVHSQLTPTPVDEIVEVDSVDAARIALARAGARRKPLSVSGARRASGGQQLCAGGVLLDARPLDRVVSLDCERGLLDVEAGCQWPALLR